MERGNVLKGWLASAVPVAGMAPGVQRAAAARAFVGAKATATVSAENRRPFRRQLMELS